MKVDYLKLKVRYFMLAKKLEKARKFLYKIERYLNDNLPDNINLKVDNLIMHTDYYIAVKDVK